MKETLQKDWWAPVWKGLVADESGKHLHRMRQSVWLFLYLVAYADRRSGALNHRIATIAKKTGASERSVRRWMNNLKKNGYISIAHTGRGHSIRILRWKTLHSSTRDDKNGERAGHALPLRADSSGSGNDYLQPESGEDKRRINL